MLPGNDFTFDGPPTTLKGKLEGKEDEAKRVLDWLKNRENKLEDGKHALKPALGS